MSQTGASCVEFVTQQNLILRGSIVGAGKSCIVFSHMYKKDKSSWIDLPILLSSKGYMVVTYDFRGHGKSQGKIDTSAAPEDLATVVYHLGQRFSIDRFFFVGASLGGMASIKNYASHIYGIVLISTPLTISNLNIDIVDLDKIQCPVLLINSENDSAGTIEDTYKIQKLIANSKEPEVFSGQAHGTDLFLSPHAEKIKTLISSFYLDMRTDD